MGRTLQATKTKVQQKFKVSVSTFHNKNQDFGLVVACLSHDQNRLLKVIDDISQVCELAGLGRLDDEITFCDDVEQLFLEAKNEAY